MAAYGMQGGSFMDRKGLRELKRAGRPGLEMGGSREIGSRESRDDKRARKTMELRRQRPARRDSSTR